MSSKQDGGGVPDLLYNYDEENGIKVYEDKVKLAVRNAWKHHMAIHRWERLVGLVLRVDHRKIYLARSLTMQEISSVTS